MGDIPLFFETHVEGRMHRPDTAQMWVHAVTWPGRQQSIGRLRGDPEASLRSPYAVVSIGELCGLRRDYDGRLDNDLARAPQRNMDPGIDIPVISGPGCFDIEVTASMNTESVAEICGARVGTVVDRLVQVHLRLEEIDAVDDTSVGIYVEGRLVGHLPRVVACDFRRAVEEGDLDEYAVFECTARIKADCGLDEAGLHHYRMWLDLPQDDHPAASDPEAPQGVDDPRIPMYRHGAVAERQIDELIGIVKGVMADGMVTQGEVEFLVRWMEVNRHAANAWPAKALYPRLAQVAAKGRMTLREEGDMLELLMKTVGGNTAPQKGYSSNSTTLPLSEPLEPLSFEGRSFCFTGAFHSGTRDWCHAQVTSRGGRGAGTITKKLDYLVIGDIGNESWAHSTHGRKIEKAIEYNAAGCRIVIVSEEHWYAHL